MLDGKQLPISRRRLLFGLSSIGTGIALGGIGTYSVYNDQEEITATFGAGFIEDNEEDSDDESENDNSNVGSAGSIDLLVDWVVVRNDTVVGQSIENNIVGTEENSNTLQLQSKGIFPGDEGCIYIALKIDGSPATISLQSETGNYIENGRNVNEINAEDPLDEEGELQEIVQTTLGQLSGKPETPTSIPPTFEQTYYEGVAENLSISGDDVELSVDDGEVVWLAYHWKFPLEAGNQYQTDAYSIDFTFNAQTQT